MVSGRETGLSRFLVWFGGFLTTSSHGTPVLSFFFAGSEYVGLCDAQRVLSFVAPTTSLSLIAHTGPACIIVAQVSH
jgi:hypothetical protein